MIHDFSAHRLGQNRTIHVLRLLVADHRAVIADQKVVRDAEPLHVAQQCVPASARHDPESVPRTPPVRYGLKVRFAHHTVAEQGSVKIAGRYLHAASSSSTSIAEPHPAQAQGLRPWNPGRGAASALRKARAALAGASRPLTRRRVCFGGKTPKQTLDGVMEVTGISLFCTAQRNSFKTKPERTPCAPPPHQSKVLGRWEVGVRGRREESPSSEGFPPSSPGMSRLHPPPSQRTALPYGFECRAFFRIQSWNSRTLGRWMPLRVDTT
jgi:hypothetical protein